MNVTQLEMPDPRDMDLANAKLAYTILDSLLHHNETLGDLIAAMAQALDEDTQQALTTTRPWENYLESRRELETTRLKIKKFVEELKKLEESSEAAAD